MRTEKSSRWAAILLATVVAIITSAVVANATQTITTPNAAFISYNLTVGASSASITPPSSRSVLVMGCCTTANDQGVGQVPLLRIPSFAIIWFGLETKYPATVTSGGASFVGAHIVFIDASQQVEIQTASADAIRVHNGSNAVKAGNVTLIW